MFFFFLLIFLTFFLLIIHASKLYLKKKKIFHQLDSFYRNSFFFFFLFLFAPSAFNNFFFVWYNLWAFYLSLFLVFPIYRSFPHFFQIYYSSFFLFSLLFFFSFLVPDGFFFWSDLIYSILFVNWWLSRQRLQIFFCVLYTLFLCENRKSFFFFLFHSSIFILRILPKRISRTFVFFFLITILYRFRYFNSIFFDEEFFTVDRRKPFLLFLLLPPTPIILFELF